MRSLVALALLMSLTALSGCSTSGTGTAGFSVSDAPTDDYSSVNVTFSRVAIHEGGNGTDSSDFGNNGSAGWHTIVETEQTVDLLALHANNTAKALGFATVPAGHYQQVRFYVDSVVATKKTGEPVPMEVPSGVLRTSGDFTVKAGGNTTINVEIDLNASINCTPQRCMFQPHLGQVSAS